MITFLYLHHAVYSGTLKFTADSLSLQTAGTHSSKRWAPPLFSQQGLPQPPPCHSCRIWHFPNGEECTNSSSSLKLISLQPGNQYLCLPATAKLIHSKAHPQLLLVLLPSQKCLVGLHYAVPAFFNITEAQWCATKGGHSLPSLTARLKRSWEQRWVTWIWCCR